MTMTLSRKTRPKDRRAGFVLLLGSMLMTCAASATAAVTFDFSAATPGGRQASVLDAATGTTATLTTYEVVFRNMPTPFFTLSDGGDTTSSADGLGIASATPGDLATVGGDTAFVGPGAIQQTFEAFLLTFSGPNVSAATRFELRDFVVDSADATESAVAQSIPGAIADPLAVGSAMLGPLVGFGFSLAGPIVADVVLLNVAGVAPFFGLADGLTGGGFLLTPGRRNGNPAPPGVPPIYLPGQTNDWTLRSVTAHAVPAPTSLSLLLGLVALCALRRRIVNVVAGGS